VEENFSVLLFDAVYWGWNVAKFLG